MIRIKSVTTACSGEARGRSDDPSPKSPEQRDAALNSTRGFSLPPHAASPRILDEPVAI